MPIPQQTIDETEIRKGIIERFSPIPPAQLWKLTPEEQQKWEDEEVERARERVKAIIADSRATYENSVYSSAIRLSGERGVLGERQDFTAYLARIPKEMRLQRLQADRSYEVNTLNRLQERQQELDAQLKQLPKDWEKADREELQEAGHEPLAVAENRRLQREAEIEGITENIELVKEAIPLFQRLITAYDKQISARLEDLAEGKKLAEKVKDIEKEAYKLAEQYNKIVAEEGSTLLILDFPDKCQRVAKKLIPLRKKLSELQEAYQPTATKLNELQINVSQVGLAGFPSLRRLDSRLEHWMA